MKYRYQRIQRIIKESIDNEGLTLEGMTVLTEAASGNYVVTPIIAAMANAEKVYVTGRDSSYGKIEEILCDITTMYKRFGISDGVIEYIRDKKSVASEVNITTNSGFVRPIDRRYLMQLPSDTAIPLMYESWEYRDGDIDLFTCKELDIPILGTNENTGHLHIFRYVGMIVMKLLLEREIEIIGARILLLSSRGYLREIKKILEINGARVEAVDVERACEDFETTIENDIFDAVVLADQLFCRMLIGDDDAIIRTGLLRLQTPVIYLCGSVDYNGIKNRGIDLYPDKKLTSNSMTIATDYVGIKPVIELNTAGLKVGQALVEGKRLYKTAGKAKEYALMHSNALPFETDQEE